MPDQGPGRGSASWGMLGKRKGHLVLRTGGRGCHWRLAGGGQGCCLCTICSARACPAAKDCLTRTAAMLRGQHSRRKALPWEDHTHHVTWPEPGPSRLQPQLQEVQSSQHLGTVCSPGSLAQEDKLPGAPRAGQASAASAGSCLLFYPGPQHSWLQAPARGEGLT